MQTHALIVSETMNLLKIIMSFPFIYRLNMESLKKMLLGDTFNSSSMLWTTATVEVYSTEIWRLKQNYTYGITLSILYWYEISVFM